MINMVRRVKPVVCASVLGLAAVQCGGGSTPQSNTPPQSNQEQANQDQSDQDPSGVVESGRSSEGTSAGSPPDMSGTATSGTAGTAESMGGERATVAGTDEPGADDSIGGAPPPALSDAQIAAITELVASTETEQAQLAQSKSKDPRVLGFARMMIEHHGQSRQRQSALGLSTAGSPMFQTLSQQGRQTVATLTDKQGKDFDRAYLQEQIEQHQRVLDALDQRLLPSARDPQLRAHLQSMRPIIQQHLQAARDAQHALNTAGQR
jgi:putative membrane protein